MENKPSDSSLRGSKRIRPARIGKWTRYVAYDASPSSRSHITDRVCDRSEQGAAPVDERRTRHAVRNPRDGSVCHNTKVFQKGRDSEYTDSNRQNKNLLRGVRPASRVATLPPCPAKSARVQRAAREINYKRDIGWGLIRGKLEQDGISPNCETEYKCTDWHCSASRKYDKKCEKQVEFYLMRQRPCLR